MSNAVSSAAGAELIELSRYDERRSPRVADTSRGAEILFFTGVRYERMEEPAARPAVAMMREAL